MRVNCICMVCPRTARVKSEDVSMAARVSWRLIGNAAAIFLMVLGFIDVPDQLQKWLRLFGIAEAILDTRGVRLVLCSLAVGIVIAANYDQILRLVKRYTTGAV